MPALTVPIPPEIKSYLADSMLTVWEAKKSRLSKDHPWEFVVTLAGPGLDRQPTGWGSSLEDALDRALRNPWFRSARPGIEGAMARLELEIQKLDTVLLMARLKLPQHKLTVDPSGVIYQLVDLDNDVPF